MTPNVLLQLEKGAIALTANRRLSVRLHQQYATQQQQNGKRVWHTPTILPLNTWLSQTWERQKTTQKTLLNDLQEFSLWQQIVARSLQDHHNLQLNATTKLAQQAWQTLQLWDISMPQLTHQHHAECELFLQWAQAVSEQCSKHHWITAASIPQQLIAQMGNWGKDLPNEIWLIGFDECPPHYS